MRLFAAVLFAACATVATADDKPRDDDKAREAAAAFLKAVKTKDPDAVLKTVDVPFLAMVAGKPKVFEKADGVRADLEGKLGAIKDAAAVPTEVGKVVPFADLKGKLADEEHRKAIEKVLGENGFVALAQTPDGAAIVILVRVKDGAAKVVGFGPR